MADTLSLYEFYLLIDSEKDNCARWVESDPDGSSDLSRQARDKMIARFRTLPERYDLNWWQRLCVKWLLWQLRRNEKADTVERTQPVQAGISGEAKTKGAKNRA